MLKMSRVVRYFDVRIVDPHAVGEVQQFDNRLNHREKEFGRRHYESSRMAKQALEQLGCRIATDGQ